jgi:circadian clock protein KaiC
MTRYPPTSATLLKCPTGIQGLDQITEGGLPQGRSTLICGHAGTGKTLMAMEFLVKGGLCYQAPGVFISFEESSPELQQNVASLGWDLAALVEQKLLVLNHIELDWHQLHEAGHYDLEALFVRLEYAIDQIQAKRVVLDTLEVLFGGLKDSAIVRQELHRLFRWLKQKGVTAVVTAEAGQNSLTRHGLEEYVSDCVIVLQQRLEGDLATRQLRIAKYRGSRHGSDEYPFLIIADGISVLPLTAAGLDYSASNERISTGNDRLDKMLGDQGFFRGSSILVSGTAGTGKTSLCCQWVKSACERGEKALYFAFEESPQQIIRNMRSISIDLASLVAQGRLQFQAFRPTSMGLEMHLVRIYQTIEVFKPSLVVIDPATSLVNQGSDAQVRSAFIRLIDFFKNLGVTVMLTNLSQLEALVAHTEVGISSIMDTWLSLRMEEHNGEHNRLLYILKSRGMPHSNQVREFQLTDHGIELYDVYLGAAGMATGTARFVQEAEDRRQAAQRQQQIERLRSELQYRRDLLDANVAALKADFRIKEAEMQQLLAADEQIVMTLAQDRRDRAILRQADTISDATVSDRLEASS